MWSVWKCREHHWAIVFVHLKKHSSSLAVGYFCPANFFFCTTFLRYHISCNIICNHICINTKFCTFFTIRIGLCLAKSIPFHTVIICVKFKDHTEFRHITEFLNRVIRKSCFHSSITKNFIRKFTFTGRCSRHNIGVRYLYRLLIHFYFWHICRAICSLSKVFVTQVHAGKFPLSVAHSHKISTVIVGWCTPEIWLRNCLDHLFSGIFIRYQTTV